MKKDGWDREWGRVTGDVREGEREMGWRKGE